MRLRSLYQTLEDRDNPDKIEDHGPFSCKRKRAWLGLGYYFWDSSIDSAHFWGNTSYKGNYIICESHYDYDSPVYLDLAGNTEHIKDFSIIADSLQEKSKQCVTVPMVIENMKAFSELLKNYKAIRAYPINSIINVNNRIKFQNINNAYMDLDPAIQMCVFDKSFLLNNKFEIIYPEMYCSDYVV